MTNKKDKFIKELKKRYSGKDLKASEAHARRLELEKKYGGIQQRSIE